MPPRDRRMHGRQGRRSATLRPVEPGRPVEPPGPCAGQARAAQPQTECLFVGTAYDAEALSRGAASRSSNRPATGRIRRDSRFALVLVAESTHRRRLRGDREDAGARRHLVEVHVEGCGHRASRPSATSSPRQTIGTDPRSSRGVAASTVFPTHAPRRRRPPTGRRSSRVSIHRVTSPARNEAGQVFSSAGGQGPTRVLGTPLLPRSRAAAAPPGCCGHPEHAKTMLRLSPATSRSGMSPSAGGCSAPR